MTDKTLVGVSGASGYIALHTIRQLLAQGYAVRGTLRDLSRSRSLAEALSKLVDTAALSFVQADLLNDAGWDAAASGCRYFLHMASPVLRHAPKDDNDLIIPARDGTLRVLGAAQRAGVERVVLTSSIAAVYSGRDVDRVFTDEDWSDLDQPISGYAAYAKSKTLAEQAAWAFVKGRAIELAVINPSLVIGPLIDPDGSASVDIVKKIIKGKIPGWPRLGFTLVDVRDVASAHLLAMTKPEAAGKRYICSSEFLWLAEIADILRHHLKPRGLKIQTRQLPDILVKFVALFDRNLRLFTDGLGVKKRLSSARLQTQLGWTTRPVDMSIKDTADSLIEHAWCL